MLVTNGCKGRHTGIFYKSSQYSFTSLVARRNKSDPDKKLQVSRSGHTVVRASSVLILFGGEDSKKRKLNDLHMFDLKSSTWLPLNCT